MIQHALMSDAAQIPRNIVKGIKYIVPEERLASLSGFPSPDALRPKASLEAARIPRENQHCRAAMACAKRELAEATSAELAEATSAAENSEDTFPMSYREENGQVILTMSREDYNLLLIYLGDAAGHHFDTGPQAKPSWEFLKRLNSGNPNYTPYQVNSEK